MSRPLALWAVPRSISTAFERMIEARGDFAVLSEPFSVAYYFSEARVSPRYGETAAREEFTPGRVLDSILETARNENVFFKDMAYHVRGCADRDFLSNFQNTFIVRHPRHTLPSLRRLLPDYTLEETGFDQQLRLFDLVRDLSGEPPVLIDGDELRARPVEVVSAYCRAVDIHFDRGALSWEPGSAPRWSTWSRWHVDVADSDGFVPPDPAESAPQGAPAGEPTEVYERCVRIYEELIADKLPIGRADDLESTFVTG